MNKEKMKIAMVFPIGESEKAISSYSTYLTEAIKKTGLNIDALNYTAGSYKSFMKIFPKLKNYDIIHIQHEFNLLGGYGIPFFKVYSKLKKLKNTKIITTLHTTLSLKKKYYENFIKTFFRKILYLTQNKLINIVSSKIIVHSNFFANILIKEYNFPKKKLKVFPLGIINNVKITEKNKAKKELGLKGPVYLIIGNLIPDHGALEILKQADKIGKTILLVSSLQAVNDRNKKRLGNYLEILQKEVKKRNFSKYVRFDIKDINDKMPKWWLYFSAADFIIQNYAEGLGSGIFAHAMATKTPVISSNSSFFREISKKYGCVKIVEKKQDFPRIINESLKPKEYNKMLKEVKRYFEDNKWSVLAKKYKEMYFFIQQYPKKKAHL